MQLPDDFVARMSHQLGDEAAAFFMALEQPAPVSVRLNPFKPSGCFENVSPVPWCRLGRYLRERPSFTLDPTFHAGAYYVQEASSMFLEKVLESHLDVSNTALALDLCAAPGGKSTHLRSLLPDQALLVSNEIIPQRNLVLCDNIIKWGHPGNVVTRNNPEDFSALSGMFDLILVDAPCSGEGMFRKDEVAVREWSLDNVHHCAVRQRSILAVAVEALAPGGLLIYSTCTWSAEEDEEIIAHLTSEYGLELLSVPGSEGIVTTKAMARFYPHRVNGEGFFIAALRKPSTNSDAKYGSAKRSRKEVSHKSTISPQVYAHILSGDFHFHINKEDIWAIPTVHRNVWELLRQQLRVVYSGCKVGSIKGKELIPAHAAAMSVCLSSGHEKIVVDQPTALRYLRGDAIEISRELSGWLLVQYDQAILGWGKAVNGRLNNHYPKELRIRMNIER